MPSTSYATSKVGAVDDGDATYDAHVDDGDDEDEEEVFDEGVEHVLDRGDSCRSRKCVCSSMPHRHSMAKRHSRLV